MIDDTGDRAFWCEILEPYHGDGITFTDLVVSVRVGECERQDALLFEIGLMDACE